MTNSVHVHVLPSPEGWNCEVEVRALGDLTRHSVRVTAADAARWSRGQDDEDVADLVRRSFDFLLEREPPTSILRSFDLAVIQRYFPEYDSRFRR
jgi:hypothetical protein